MFEEKILKYFSEIFHAYRRIIAIFEINEDFTVQTNPYQKESFEQNRQKFFYFLQLINRDLRCNLKAVRDDVVATFENVRRFLKDNPELCVQVNSYMDKTLL